MNIGILSCSGVSIERLLSFRSVYQAGSLVKAAGGDPNKQSQYSRQLGELEKAMGIELFRREKKRLTPTKAAKELFFLLQDFSSALNGLVEREKTGRETFRIGASRFVLESFLIPRIGMLRKQFAQTMWTFRSGTTQEISNYVKAGDLEMGIVRQDAELEGLSTRPFTTIDYVLAVHRELLPERSAAGIDLIGQLPFVTLSGEGRYVQGLEAVTRNRRLNLHIVAELDSFELIFRMLEEDSLAAVLPRGIARRLPAERYAIIENEALASLRRLLVVIHRGDPEKDLKITRVLEAFRIAEAVD